MGDYIAQADLDIPNDTLIDLVDDEGVGSIDANGAARINAAINDAEALINGYCAGRYSVPFSTVPPMVPILAKRVTEYNLYQRRDHMPETVEKAYNNALKMLQDIAKGVLSLGADPAPTAATNSNAAQIDKTTNDRLFTRGKMRGF